MLTVTRKLRIRTAPLFDCVLAAVVVWAGYWPASSAFACSPEEPCSGWGQVRPISSEIIEGGVLLLAAPRYHVTAPEFVGLEIEVRDASDDHVVDGQLTELGPRDGVLVWQPKTPLESGTQLTVEIHVDNEALLADSDSKTGGVSMHSLCDPHQREEEFEIDVVSGDPRGITVPGLKGETSFRAKTYDLSQVACCDGAQPVRDSCSGIYLDDSDEGTCAFVEGIGQMRVELEFDTSEISEAERSGLVWRLETVDQSFSHPQPATRSLLVSEPVCLRVEVMNVVTGKRKLGKEHCFGADNPEKFGTLALDLGDTFAQCNDAPMTCTKPTDSTRWSQQYCRAAEVDYGQAGCSTRRQGPGITWLLVAALAWVRRRA